MNIVLRGQDGVVEQARRQLEDLVPVWVVLDYSHSKIVERELLLAKVSILGPEHFHELIAHHREDFQDEPDAEETHEVLSPGNSIGRSIYVLTWCDLRALRPVVSLIRYVFVRIFNSHFIVLKLLLFAVHCLLADDKDSRWTVSSEDFGSVRSTST